MTTTTQEAATEDKWIYAMTQFFNTRLPPNHLTLDAKKRLVVWSWNFCLIADTPYHKGSDDIWSRAVRQFEKHGILREAHYGIAWGHYDGNATGWKIWQSGLWWPTTKKDAHEFYRQCDWCQCMCQPTERAHMPHKPILPLELFQKWDLDFVCPFKPAAAWTGNKYITSILPLELSSG